ncbi:MAG: glycyl-radical enzyme activating protein [Ruminococcaceae bacterium]|nr:glycyl-radical enzyme activating protein [Oscillospiraceae bacterium]
MENLKAFVFDIYRGTTHDGPGMRTTVFFKGCPLHCAWCHNPESISPKQQVWWDSTACIGCFECVKSCPFGCCKATESGIYTDTASCTLCGKCVKACPSGAQSFIGKNYSAEELVKEAEKYKTYYKNFGGGVTASGGEPMLQHKFVRNFFALLKTKGIHTALDTCGAVPYSYFEEVSPFTDCILFDIKVMDSNAHQKYTGKPNEQILENLKRIAEDVRCGKYNSELWIRTPLIPNITATEENVTAIAKFINENLLDVVTRWELCTFNKACQNKYHKLNFEWTFSDYPLITKNNINSIKDYIKKTSFPEEKLVISGMLSD